MLPTDIQTIVDDVSAVLCTLALGGIVSAMAYGIAFVLFVVCFRLLLVNTKRTRRIRFFLLVYIPLMFTVATIALVAGIFLHINVIRQSFLLLLKSAGISQSYTFFRHVDSEKVLDWCMVLATWGADGFMLWRCCVLYDAAMFSGRVALYLLCGILTTVSLLAGVLYAIPSEDRSLNLVVFASITLSINVVISIIIVSRLIYHQRSIRRALGRGHGSPYRRIISMCVESAALVIIFDVIAIVLFVTPPLSGRSPNTFLPVFVQAYVISAFLIIYKVTGDERVLPGPSDLRTVDIEAAINRLQPASVHQEPLRRSFQNPSAMRMRDLPSR